MVLAREDRGGAAHCHDEVWLRAVGEGGSNEVDDRPFRRTHRPYRPHHDLHEVYRLVGALIQFDMEICGEAVDHQIAAVDRLQHEDLFLDRLSAPVRCRPEHQDATQHDAGEPATRADATQEPHYVTPPCILCVRIQALCVER